MAIQINHFYKQLLPPLYLPVLSLWPAHPLLYQQSVNNRTSTLCRVLPETHLPPPVGGAGAGYSSEPISSLAFWELSWVSCHRLVFRGWVEVHNVYEGSTLVEVKVARSGLGRGRRAMPGPQSPSQGSRELPRVWGALCLVEMALSMSVLLPLVVCSSGTHVASGKGTLCGWRLRAGHTCTAERKVPSWRVTRGQFPVCHTWCPLIYLGFPSPSRMFSFAQNSGICFNWYILMQSIFCRCYRLSFFVWSPLFKFKKLNYSWFTISCSRRTAKWCMHIYVCVYIYTHTHTHFFRLFFHYRLL